MTLLMIIMAVVASSGFIALGLSFISHKVRLEEEREAAEHNRATVYATHMAGWPAG